MQSLFDRYLQEQADLAPETLVMFGRCFKPWSAFCERRGLALEQVTEEHLKAYEQELLWTPNGRQKLPAPATVDQNLRSLRAFLRWAHRGGHLEFDCTQGWLLARPVSRPQALLTRAQLDSLFQSPDLSTPLGMRDGAILSVIAELGLLSRGCRLLDVADLDLAGARLGRLSLGARLHEKLSFYMKRARPALLAAPEEAALFLSREGRRLSEESVAAVVLRHARAQVQPRALRKAWLTHHQAALGRRLPEL